MATVTTLGVDHIGVGVSDMTRSAAFWGELGFTERAFEYEGGVVGPGARDPVDAHVLMLRPATPSVLGPGAVKLVRLADGPPPQPEGIAWGERGVCEVCVHVTDQRALYERLVAAGHAGLMEPNTSELTPYGTTCSLSYVADPDGCKIELIEWVDLEAGWPWPDGPQGVNHVAFGVASMDRAGDFWRALGFSGMLFDSDGYFEPMHPWYEAAGREPPRQKMRLLTNPRGGGLEPVEHMPPSPDMRGEWGRLGAHDFGIGVRNLDRALAELDALGVSLVGEPQTISLDGGGTWRYAYLDEPDGNYVCLCEARY